MSRKQSAQERAVSNPSAPPSTSPLSAEGLFDRVVSSVGDAIRYPAGSESPTAFSPGLGWRRKADAAYP